MIGGLVQHEKILSIYDKNMISLSIQINKVENVYRLNEERYRQGHSHSPAS